MTEDFYDLLDVPSDASQDAIKGAFREQVRVYHPDLNDDDRAQAQFTALKKAYDILGDPVERQAYDRLGHEDYVAKRTKGLPSPDLWKTKEADDEDQKTVTASTSSSGGTGSRSSAGSASRSATRTGSAGAGSSRSTSRSRSSSRSTERSGSSTGASSASSSSASSTVGGARASAAGTGTTGGRTSSTAGTARGGSVTAGSTSTGGASQSNSSRSSQSRPGRLTDNALVRWWRNRRFAWPLIWAAALLYVAGLIHFVAENAAALRSLADELAALGADPNAIWETSTAGRHGIETAIGFVSGLELVAPPLPPTQWYGALVGFVALALSIVIGARVAWRRNTWGPVSIDETIVVALAVGTSATIVGGPLLAGALLMPLLFGVIVHRTRQLPGWNPSYAYVLAVCAPGVALASGAFGYASLPTDFLAYGLLPIAGAFGLPLRASVRKRFGR